MDFDSKMDASASDLHHDRPLLFPLAIASLVLVALLTTPPSWTLWKQIRKKAPKDNFYEDRDGKSTPEAVAAFSNTKHKATVLLFSVIGAGTSIAVSVLTAIESEPEQVLESWLVTASWVSYGGPQSHSLPSCHGELTVDCFLGSYRSTSHHPDGNSCPSSSV
jgi:hypothetical protein